MNLRELIDAFRDDTKDLRKPYLVSDRLATRFANRSESDAARRARLLVDSTSAVCEVSVSAGDPVVGIDSRIISIRRARLQSNSTPLNKRKVRDMDEQFPGWDSSSTQSTPYVLVVDYGTNQLRLYPTPKEATALLLTVTREPLSAMAKMEDFPEIAPRYHDGIVEGMKLLAYSTNDTDLFDPKLAAIAQAAFIAEFGQPISAVDEQFEFENYHDVGER